MTHFRPHRSTTYVDAACCYRPSIVVCLSAGLSVTIVSPAKRLNRSIAVWVVDSSGPCREPCIR